MHVNHRCSLLTPKSDATGLMPQPLLLFLITFYYYTALFSALEQTHALACDFTFRVNSFLLFFSAFLNIRRSGVLTALTWLVPHEAAAVSAYLSRNDETAACAGINYIFNARRPGTEDMRLAGRHDPRILLTFSVER